MPSTEYFGYELTNYGPLTTTFSAAASCASDTANWVVVDNAFEEPMILATSCDTISYGDECMPSAAALNSAISRALAGKEDHQALGYHSPGFVCPSGWTTAGAASQEGNSLSAAGIFTEDVRPGTDDQEAAARGFPMVGMYLQALGDDERVVLCCPSEHAIDINAACVSSIGPLEDDSPTICQLLVSYDNIETVTSFDGSIWDPPLLTGFDVANTPAETVTETLETPDPDRYHMAAYTQAIPMYYKESDRENDSASKTGDDNDAKGGDENGDDDDDGDEEDAARSVHALSPPSLGAFIVGLLAGAGILIPW